jgi:PD-(D/E)XK nuclease family transposase
LFNLKFLTSAGLAATAEVKKATPRPHQIAKLDFRNTENMPDLPADRKAIFDIYCTAVSGERFIVEMQKAKMHYFKDRSLFYSTFPIKEQAIKGDDWDFKLQPV